MLHPNTSRSRVGNLDHNSDNDDNDDVEYDGHHRAHSMESYCITTKTLPRRIYQPAQPQRRRRTNCCVSRQSNGVPRSFQRMARVVVRLVLIVWMVLGTFINFNNNPTNHDRRHDRRRSSDSLLFSSSLSLLRWWWLPNQHMMTVMMMMTCTTVMVVVQADWIDPDTPEQYYSTQPLTTGDEREFQLVRCFLLSFHTHTTISRHPLFGLCSYEKRTAHVNVLFHFRFVVMDE